MKYESKFDFISKVVDHYDKLKYALLEAQTFDEEHFGFPNFYYKVMETDTVRVDAFRNAFKKYRNLKNKVVCEIGVGTLALTKHYLPYVKKAYLIESNPNVINIIQKELKANGWADKCVVMHADALTMELPEKVDYIIGELMSIFCANELQVQIFKHMRRFLKPNGKLLPEKIINLAQLCHASFEDGHGHYPLFFTRHLPTQYTPQKPINTINLYRESKVHIQRQTRFKPMLSGTVNAVYLHSWIQVAEGCNFTGTDSLMPPTVVKLSRPMKVKSGETVVLSSDYQYGTSLKKAKFRLSRPK
ncbi:MAG: methyltransferase domain-containing protein [Bacteroidota bacterium]